MARQSFDNSFEKLCEKKDVLEVTKQTTFSKHRKVWNHILIYSLMIFIIKLIKLSSSDLFLLE